MQTVANGSVGGHALETPSGPLAAPTGWHLCMSHSPGLGSKGPSTEAGGWDGGQVHLWLCGLASAVKTKSQPLGGPPSVPSCREVELRKNGFPVPTFRVETHSEVGRDGNLEVCGQGLGDQGGP